MIECGFDNGHSLKSINESTIKLVESHVNQNRDILNKLDCRHKESYQQQKQFNFLPGHYVALTNNQNFVQACSSGQDATAMQDNPAFSALLKALIASALNNFGREPSGYRYSQLVHEFSMYIYMLGGKANYEVISANLPLPKVVTISMTFDSNNIYE